MIILWALPALAVDLALPPFPAQETIAGECPQAWGLDVGKRAPPALVDSTGSVLCSAVALPVGQAAYHLEVESWAHAAAEKHALDVLHLQGQVDSTAQERDWYREQLVEAQRVSFWARPWVNYTLGSVATLSVVGVVLYAQHL